MSKKKRIKPGRAQSLRKWETDDSASFPAFVRYLQAGVTPQPVPQTRQILSKHRPIYGHATVEADGWRAPTNFQAYVCKMIPMEPFDYVIDRTPADSHYGSSCTPSDNATYGIFAGCSGAQHLPRTSTNLVNRCTTEALNKLKDGKVNVAESIATLNQTLRMVASLASRMKFIWDTLHAKQIARQALWDRARDAYYASVGRGKSRSAQRRRIFFRTWGLPPKRPPSDWYRRKSAGLWLELQYGWKPLVSDIQSALSGQIKLPPPCITVVRHLEENDPLPASNGNSGTAPYIHSVSGEIRNGCRVRLDAQVTNPGLALLDSLSLVNPFSLGWELSPYSFVIDWLIPIGNAISALSATCGLSSRGQSITRYTEMHMDVMWTSFKFKSGTKIHSRIESLSTWRTGSRSFSLPRLYIKSPFTSATRAATALALLTANR